MNLSSNTISPSTFQKWDRVGEVRISRSGKVLIVVLDGMKYFVYVDAVFDLANGYKDVVDVYEVPHT